MMPVVRVEPAGLEFEVEAGESVAEAAWRLGYAWPTVCWGQAECMVCFTDVIDGEDNTEAPGDEELVQMQMRLPARSWTPHTRLACRLKITGPGVVLEKRGVRPPRAS
jgi:ferredoxin, 2Fe-2S